MRLVLCDRYRLFAESFSHALSARGHSVVLVTSPEAAVDAAVAEPTAACLLELEFGAERIIATIEVLRRERPELRVIILCGIEDLSQLAPVLSIGVTAVVSKEQSLDNVIDTLASLMNGHVPGRRPLRSTGLANGRGGGPTTGISELTSREREVLGLLAAGQGTGALARSLRVSHSTARTHIQNVLAKLEVHSRLEAVALLHQDPTGLRLTEETLVLRKTEREGLDDRRTVAI